MKSLLVVCPVYNEERVIVAFHEELRRALGRIPGWRSRVLYVVDRGSPRSRAIAAARAGVTCAPR